MVEYYTAKKELNLLIYKNWMNLYGIMLSEIEKDKCYMISLIYEFWITKEVYE